MKTIVHKIKPSATLSINNLANKLRSEGKSILKFGIGEPDFPTPDNIKQAAINAIENNLTKYTDSSGIPELKKAICEKFKRENNIDYDIDEIFVSNGAKQTLYSIFASILDEGDEVIIHAPYWISYPEQVKLAGGKPIIIQEENDCRINPENFEKYITKKTKAIVINSPSNPTGLIISKEDLLKIKKIALKYKIYVISDEVYEHFIYDNHTHTSIASLGEDIKNLTFTVNSVAKTYCMTGWRIGYVGGPTDIIKHMGNFQSQIASNPCTISQYASIEALKGSQDSVNKMLSDFDKRRKITKEGFDSIKEFKCLPCEGAFYTWINIEDLLNEKTPTAQSFAKNLLEKTGIVVVPGNDFGIMSYKYIRFSYASSEEDIKKAFEILKNLFT